MSEPLIANFAHAAHDLRRQILDNQQRHPWQSLFGQVRERHGGEASSENLADTYAQAVACCLLMSRFAVESMSRDAGDWLVEQSDPLWQGLARECLQAVVKPSATGELLEALDVSATLRLCERAAQLADPAEGDTDDWLLAFFEQFLRQYSPRRRSRCGVYYTPRPLVQFIVRSIDESLRQEFALPDGLADTARRRQVLGECGASGENPFLRIMDPAAGAGLFLVETIRAIHRRLTRKWSQDAVPDPGRRWNDYVTRDLLPRISGCELLLPATIVAHFRLVAELAKTGFHFRRRGGIQVAWMDALAEPRDSTLRDCRRETTVVLGNPPYSGVSQNHGRWINDLLRGRLADGGSYYEVDGKSLGERKLWLQDDYVKFIRLAQWMVHSNGAGIVGFVSNHGYLDNPTFRGMRQQLLKTFPLIALVDLHGNVKKRERSPRGDIDQNVFAVEQGVAIGLFRKLPPPDATGRITRADLWGSREEKLSQLQHSCLQQWESAPATSRAPASVKSVALGPRKPYYFFSPNRPPMEPLYRDAWPLNKAMPVNCTAPVTARDGFVVAFSFEELIGRLREFADMSVSDEQIRERFFHNTRSAKYAAGDTRGWKLAEARRRFAGRRDWRQDLHLCHYRPFDDRPLLWIDSMIDWPRTEFSKHILAGPNWALIARRQMPPTQPCNFFWITDKIALDGVIRSDNRGSESLFPLYLYEPSHADEEALGGVILGAVAGAAECSRQASGEGKRAGMVRANFDGKFVSQMASSVGLRWRELGSGDLHTTFGPDDLLSFIYGLFHSPSYRERFADWLRIEFPRIPLPRNARVFADFCRVGRELMHVHAGREMTSDLDTEPRAAFHRNGAEANIAPGYPKYRGDRIAINSRAWFAPVEPTVWEYRVGSHQVCRKWLRDRRGRVLGEAEIQRFRRILQAIARTHRLVQDLEAATPPWETWPSEAADASHTKLRPGASLF